MHQAATAMNPAGFAAAIATASANAAATGGTALASVPSASDMSVAAPSQPVSTTMVVSVPAPTPAKKDDSTTTTIIIVVCAVGGVLVVAGVGLAVYFGVFSSGSPAASSGIDTAKPPAPTSADVSTVGASGTGRS